MPRKEPFADASGPLEEPGPPSVASRRADYAAYVTTLAGCKDPRIAAAFAAVERERFCGAGPWKIATGAGYVATDSNDAGGVYQNVAVGLIADRGLNNGEPSSHAFWLDALAAQPGERVVHVGAGAGYYSAILAELVGPRGRVDAFEIEPGLAEEARENLRGRANVVVHACSGAIGELPEADTIYVNAGASRVSESWLDALAAHGRLMVPLTPDHGIGGMLLITRASADHFGARFVSGAVFFPCADARDVAEAARLKEAFAKGGATRVRVLRRDDQFDASTWFKGEGWRLCEDPSSLAR